MPVSRDEVINAFRLILGRDPGSEFGIEHHMKLADVDELAIVLLRSTEFQASARFKDFLQVRPLEREGRPSAHPHASRGNYRALILGNCQVATIGRLMQAMSGDIVAETLETTPTLLHRISSGDYDLEPMLARADFVYVQMLDSVTNLIQETYAPYAAKIRSLPPINYSAFHPDCVYIRKQDGSHLQGPMGDYHSSIAFWAWSQRWTAAETLGLFDERVYDLLEFDSHQAVSRKVLTGFGKQANLPLEGLMHRWDQSGVWMHTINHPTIAALAGLTADLLRREGIDPIEEGAAMVADTLVYFPVWPVYPPIAARLGVQGSYLFKLDRGAAPSAKPNLFLTLESFIDASFECYEDARADTLRCDRIRGGNYHRLAEFRNSGPARPAAATVPASPTWLGRLFGARPQETPEPSGPAVSSGARNPYHGLADHQFWRRGVERVALADMDPVVRVPWKINSGDRVATAGSCFAQHIARTLSKNGLNYFVAEAGEHLAVAERQERQFGLYSARYGNLYTARQLVQLFERAYGRFQPVDTAWQRPDGRFVDPFRPQVEPAGYATAQEVQAGATEHLATVRTMFEQMDVFVFTLGLTESWQRLQDGAVFPLAPGVVAGSFDERLYRFVNFSVGEVVNDIRTAMLRIRSVNTRARFIFTVSPVPLIATYENRHVLVSTVESKAVLRAAIGEVAAADPNVVYFPSFEIITGQHAGNRYFASDLRSVTEEGVAHVMRLFMQHCTSRGGVALPPRPAATPSPSQLAAEAEQREVANVICDEEAIERHRNG